LTTKQPHRATHYHYYNDYYYNYNDNNNNYYSFHSFATKYVRHIDTDDFDD